MHFAKTICAAAVLIVSATTAFADELPPNLPKATQAVLEQLKLKPEILNGLDKELAVPAAWIENAKKSPTVKMTGPDDVVLYAKLLKPFQERYPFIKVQYDTGGANDRVVKPLVAYRTGRYITDVVFSMNATTTDYAKDDISANLKDLPTYNSSIEGANPEDGFTVGFRARPYCISYNTQLVPRDQLPKTWADLPNTKILAKGRIGAAMQAHLWMDGLWGKYGEAWVSQYLDDYFKKLQPSIRSEGINVLVALVGAGELYASMPAYPERVKELQDKSAPVGWYCPDMVPLNFSRVAIFKNSPGTWAGRIYLNWLLSKEGQLTQLAVFGTPPIHKDLQSPDFYLFPNEMLGKPFLSFDDQAATDKFQAMWKKYALSNSQKR
jgi:iron(III) transport system substrate-binding protein